MPSILLPFCTLGRSASVIRYNIVCSGQVLQVADRLKFAYLESSLAVPLPSPGWYNAFSTKRS
jgi:hypothetical protein